MSLDSHALWIVTIAVCAALMMGFTLFARSCGSGPAVSLKKLELLRVGMTTDEVTALLGEPREKRPGEKREEFWVYGARWKRNVLVAAFGPDRRLQNFVHGTPTERQKAHGADD
ncbi:MAG TPA: hypothetical protein VK530_01495 [Candidatus Acidoferrum sp.]|nr:hypothetical protein [Candidatus Acidoferrum sp.]